MNLEMSESDHRAVDALLDGILEAYKNDEVTLGQAREVLAHLLYAGSVRDNPYEFRDWLKPERLSKWKEECRAART